MKQKIQVLSLGKSIMMLNVFTCFLFCLHNHINVAVAEKVCQFISCIHIFVYYFYTIFLVLNIVKFLFFLFFLYK